MVKRISPQLSCSATFSSFIPISKTTRARYGSHPGFKMQSMQRQFGKLWNKGPGENAKVAVLLNDYEDADNVLAKVL